MSKTPDHPQLPPDTDSPVFGLRFKTVVIGLAAVSPNYNATTIPSTCQHDRHKIPAFYSDNQAVPKCPLLKTTVLHIHIFQIQFRRLLFPLVARCPNTL